MSYACPFNCLFKGLSLYKTAVLKTPFVYIWNLLNNLPLFHTVTNQLLSCFVSLAITCNFWNHLWHLQPVGPSNFRLYCWNQLCRRLVVFTRFSTSCFLCPCFILHHVNYYLKLEGVASHILQPYKSCQVSTCNPYPPAYTPEFLSISCHSFSRFRASNRLI